MFLIETGRVRLTRVLADGTPLILYVAAAGESFAEASLSAATYHCDAIAETDTAVLSLPEATGFPPCWLIRPNASRWHWHLPSRCGICAPGWL